MPGIRINTTLEDVPQPADVPIFQSHMVGLFHHFERVATIIC